MHAGSLPDQGGTLHFTGLPPNKADRGTWLDAIWLGLEKPEKHAVDLRKKQSSIGALLDWIRQRFHNEADESSLNMPRVTAGAVGGDGGPRFKERSWRGRWGNHIELGYNMCPIS
ncbi:hypothetical protein QIS74_10904 [Colletotrichum tabaci]|uniref:Uncharacterized protein n=1 Tax=Colletotrichum tabaci TaxID=1209068 RepID=A0AAV9T1N6_9PEZI